MKFRRPPLIIIAQCIVRWFFRMLFVVVYQIRVHGLKNYPVHDGFLICANHQSFLDPIVLGVVCPRPINFLGRSNLFRFKPMGWFLKWNDTIPIDRDNNSLGGIKEALRRLKRGESVMIFPEGTRTRDGELQPIKPGFCALARRTRAPLVPICFAGAFEAMPRTRPIPIPGTIHAVIGEPIEFEQYKDLSDEETVKLLTDVMESCFQQARRYRRSASIFRQRAE